MKASTRLFKLVMSATVVASLLLAACGPQPTSAPANTEPAAEPTTAPTEAAAPTEAPTEAAAPTEAPTKAPEAEPVTIRYAAWNVGTEEENNVQRQLIKAYTDAHPNVTIEFVDMSGEGGWEANLTAYAAKGQLPDVFMASNVPLYVQNKWLADLTDLTANDSDFKDIPQILRDSFTYQGKILAVPSGMLLMGYFVNKDLFNAANLDAPEYGVSVADFEAAVEALTNVDKSVLGVDEIEPIMGWYPHTQDANLMYFSFDGEKMNYNSAAFKDAVAEAAKMLPYSWTGLPKDKDNKPTVGAFKSVGPWELFLNQEVAFKWDGAWALPDYVSKATFDWDYIGIPGGSQALVADALAVSSTSANVEEAYNFAKWMGFSKEGYAKQAELAKAAGSAPNTPVSLDDASLALYRTFVDKPGINTALENLDSSVVESLAKAIPGYINARWEGKPGIDIGDQKDVNMGFMLGNAPLGLFKFEDYSAQLEEFANKQLADAAAAVNK